jgi:hypothetical protein
MKAIFICLLTAFFLVGAVYGQSPTNQVPPVQPVTPVIPADSPSAPPVKPVDPKIEGPVEPVPVQSLPSTNPNELNKAKPVNPGINPQPVDTTRKRRVDSLPQ